MRSGTRKLAIVFAFKEARWLLFQCGSSRDCLSRFVPDIHQNVVGTLNNQLTNNYRFVKQYHEQGNLPSCLLSKRSDAPAHLRAPPHVSADGNEGSWNRLHASTKTCHQESVTLFGGLQNRGRLVGLMVEGSAWRAADLGSILAFGEDRFLG